MTEYECATCGRWVVGLLCRHCTSDQPQQTPEAWPVEDDDEDDEGDVTVCA